MTIQSQWEHMIGGWLIGEDRRDELTARSQPMPFCGPRDSRPLESPLGIKRWMQIENQRSMGSCAGHARTSVTEACVYLQTRGMTVQLSRMFAYITGQMVDGLIGRDCGSTIAGHAEASKKWGTCYETTFPYPQQYTTRIPEGAYNDAAQFKLLNSVELRSYDDCLTFLTMGLGGIQIGIGWNQSCDPVNGVIENYHGGGGGHSVAILDWSTQIDSQGKPYLVLFNSWGREWGNCGTAEVSPRAVEQMIRSQYAVFIGFSDMANLKPRPFDWTKESFFS